MTGTSRTCLSNAILPELRRDLRGDAGNFPLGLWTFGLGSQGQGLGFRFFQGKQCGVDLGFGIWGLDQRALNLRVASHAEEQRLRRLSSRVSEP